MSTNNQTAPDAQSVREQTLKVVADEIKHPEWWATICSASVTTLIEATSQLSATPANDKDRAAKIKARREAIISEVERRTMHDLDAATGKLTWVGIVLALIGAVAATLEILQICGVLPK